MFGSLQPIALSEELGHNMTATKKTPLGPTKMFNNPIVYTPTCSDTFVQPHPITLAVVGHIDAIVAAPRQASEMQIELGSRPDPMHQQVQKYLTPPTLILVC